MFELIQVVFSITLIFSVLFGVECFGLLLGRRIFFPFGITTAYVAYPSLLFQVHFWSSGMFL